MANDKKTKIDDLPTFDDITDNSGLLNRLEIEEEEEEELEEPEDSSKKSKDKNEPPEDPKEEPEPNEDLTEEEEKDIFESIKEKDPSELNEAETEIFNKYKDKAEEEEDIWEAVEAFTGKTVEVEYGEVDPSSVEGIAVRDEAIRKQTQESVFEYLEKTFPEPYKILQHYANGGELKDFYQTRSVDYSKVEIKEDNEDQQKAFLLDYYMNVKGLDKIKAEKIIELDTEQDLYKTATSALKELQEDQKEQEEEILQQQAEIKKQQDQKDKQFIEALSSYTDSGKIGEFMIPEKEREEFNKSILQNIQRDGNGGYVYVLPVANQSIEQVLQQAYFGYKKGDIAKLVDRKAKTQNVAKLKLQIKKQRENLKSNVKEISKRKSLPTFDDLTT